MLWPLRIKHFKFSDIYNRPAPEWITIAEHFTKGQIAEFQEAFALFDRKGDGTIPVEELPTVLRALGLDRQKDRYEAMMSKLTVDKNGMLDFPQFLELMEPVLEETDMEDELLEAFQLFDKDKNGFISVATMRYLLSDLEQKLTEEEIDAIIDMADIDGNGMIDYKKFIKRMSSKAYGPKKRRQKDERKQKAKGSQEKTSIRKRNRRASYSFY